MKRFSWIAFFLGIMGMMVSYVAFSYLAEHPSLVLWIETRHPSNAYQHGRELFRQGKWREAVEAVEVGVNYFEKLYEETGLPRHRFLYALGLLEIANIYKDRDNPAYVSRSIELYKQVLDLAPTISMGQPYLALGTVWLRLNRYEEAIEALTHAIDLGTVDLALHATHARGRAYLMNGNVSSACRDWFLFCTYYDRVTDDDYRELLKLPLDACTGAPYIHGRAEMTIGDRKKAEQLFERFIEANPDHVGAVFYLNRLTQENRPWPDRSIHLENLFPPMDRSPRICDSLGLVWFSQQSGAHRLSVTLSNRAETETKVSVFHNRRLAGEWFVLSVDPQLHAMSIEMVEGENYIWFETERDQDHSKRETILLHSIEISRLNP